LLHLTPDKVYVSTHETELAEEQRDVSHDFACFAITLLTYLWERASTNSVVDLDQHMSAQKCPAHGYYDADCRKEPATVDEVQRHIQDASTDEAFEDREGSCPWTKLLHM